MSKPSKTLKLKTLNKALYLALFMLPLSLLAQTAGVVEEAAEENALEEVIVTGTHIAGLDPAVLPVTIMGAEQIEALGATNMQDILSYIPSITDLDFDDANTGTNGARGDVAGVNMRGLGSGNTLVLLNGRRMVTHPTFQAINSVPVTFYNVNSIASSSIQRIEVLRDGAAPLYGADAIAGVVNFVPYTSYEGLKLTGKFGWSDDTSYDETEVTVAGGFMFNEGRSNLSLFATYYDRSHVHQNELPDLYYQLDRRQNPAIPTEWQGDSQLRNDSSLTPYARFRVGQLNANGTFTGPTRHISPTTGAIANGSGPARYNFNEDQWVTPETDRFNFMATYTQEIDNGVEFFADAYYYESSSRTIRAASPLDDSLAFLIVPVGAFYNPYPTQEVLIIGWRPVDLGPRIIDVDQDSYRIMGGFRGSMGSWDWETAMLYSEAESKDTEGNRQAKSLFTSQLLVNGPDALNPFAGPGGNTQAALDGIRVSATDVRTSELVLADMRFNRGDLFQAFGNDAGAAVGLEFRNEKYIDDRDPRLDGSMPFTNGAIFDESDLIGVSATFDSEASRSTASAYGELYIPLIGEANAKPFAQAFEVQLAARYENTNDFESTLKPKIGLRYEPGAGFSIRASYTEGFRAPNLPQMNQGDIIRRIDGIEDPMRAAVTGSPIDTGDTYRRTTRLGNPDLDPEDSETSLLGFVWQPDFGGDWGGGFTIGADFWNIKLDGVVGLIEEEDQLDLDELLRGQGSFNPNVIRAPLTASDAALFAAYNLANPNAQKIAVGEATNIIGQYSNLDPREVSGWDGFMSYATPETSAGQFTLRADVTQITKFEQQGLAQSDLIARNGNPEWRYTVALDWMFYGFNTNLSMRYVDDVYDTSLVYDTSKIAANGPPQKAWYDSVTDNYYWKVDSWTVYNIAIGYDFSYLSSAAKGVSLAAGVRNLTDEDAPFADESPGFYPGLHDMYGRVYWMKLGYSF